MAHLPIIDEIDYTEYGFNFCDGLYTPILNSDPMAPDAVIKMVSRKSCISCVALFVALADSRIRLVLTFVVAVSFARTLIIQCLKM